MSAYVVEKETIDLLIAAGLKAELFLAHDANANGQMLWRENVVSVAFRYNLAIRDATELAEYERDVEGYEYTAPATFTYRAVVSAIDCLDYQSCEHEAWPTSEAYALLEQLRRAFPEPIKPYMWRGTLNGV